MDPFEGHLSNGHLILMPDEITYLNWIEQRGLHFFLIFSGERSLFDITNMFGYYPSFIYKLSGDWLFTLAIGLIGLVLYNHSLKKLIYEISLEKYFEKIQFILIFSPGIILLSIGILRDLYLVSFVLYLFTYLIRREYIKIFIFLLLIFFTRNFILFFCLPFILYFFLYFNSYRNRIVLLVCCLQILSMLLVVNVYPSVNDTGISAIFLRVISAVFFINIATFDIQTFLGEDWLFKLDRLGLFFQFIFAAYAYFKLLQRRISFNIIFFMFFSCSISLGILYGHILGFFVFRTRLILFVLFVITYYTTMNQRNFRYAV
ncbi:hypothetical protein I6M49_07255 [Shewanella algae]|uniref:hypothetical protein n=1 Tax=Shewanella algae TaxID=38313 RepID=UPI001AACD0DE|nr:hypothetical protein [Shewanella algae]MBO2653275.1 hypothetical protein [Shewanella algae]